MRTCPKAGTLPDDGGVSLAGRGPLGEDDPPHPRATIRKKLMKGNEIVRTSEGKMEGKDFTDF
jgi:hypothetical protein